MPPPAFTCNELQLAATPLSITLLFSSTSIPLLLIPPTVSQVDAVLYAIRLLVRVSLPLLLIPPPAYPANLVLPLRDVVLWVTPTSFNVRLPSLIIKLWPPVKEF